MLITIHRGIKQIGGCITEIASASGHKILIDLGHNLPDGDNRDNDPLDRAENLDPLLEGVDAVFYTHSHGDHVAFEAQVAKKGIRQYIGNLSKELMLLQRDSMLYRLHKSQHAPKEAIKKTEASRTAIDSFITYETDKPVTVGDITVTPYYVSHSAPDAYMFVIRCDRRTVLHTGDFRDHGYRGNGLQPTIRKYIIPRRVDVLITEGTMLARDDSRVMSEEEIYKGALELAKRYKYLFVMCTTQDADRISSLHHAAAAVKRRLLVDGYQFKVLEKFADTLGRNNNIRYKYPLKYCYHKHWDEVLDKHCKTGFIMLVRNNRYFKKDLNRILPHLDPDQCCLVYSQFLGYILEKHTAFQQGTYDFVHSHPWHIEYLHTSGHASREALTEVCTRVNPRLAIIPIHRDATSDFCSLDIPQQLKEKVTTQSTTLEDVKIIIK